MSRRAVSVWLLGALLAAGAHGADPQPAVPEELRDTLPGGSRLGDAPELPGASIDVLPRPTQISIQVKRQAPPGKKD
jgi:hypothetical protein